MAKQGRSHRRGKKKMIEKKVIRVRRWLSDTQLDDVAGGIVNGLDYRQF
jgi:hypothetical protein